MIAVYIIYTARIPSGLKFGADYIHIYKIPDIGVAMMNPFEGSWKKWGEKILFSS